MVRLAPRSYHPDPRTHDVYAERYAQYRALYDGTESALA
jgi:sugar (pentulose or hexulose) kinase